MTAPTIDAMFQNVPEKKEDEAPQAIKRDRWGRPLIKQANGTEVPYIRASTMAGALDDKTALGDWKARKTGRGVAISPDLQAGFAAIPDMDSKEGKATANELAEQAQERAGSSHKRVLGTAIHSFTEMLDKGQRPPHIPDPLSPLIEAYVRETAGVRWLAFEQFVVVDEVQAAGTADRVGVLPGEKPRIWDIKTGRVDYGQLKFAIQLALYARGMFYNPSTGERRPWPDMDLEVGHILHVDPETGQVTKYDVDLTKGWAASRAARMVYDMRKDKSVMKPSERIVEAIPAQQPAIAPGVPVLSQSLAPITQAMPGESREDHAARVREFMETPLHPNGQPKTIMQRLSACRSIDEIKALYAETGSQWEEKHRKFSNIMAEDIRGRQQVSEVAPHV